MAGRRDFGNVRERTSGRWQARYKWEAAWHVGPHMFASRTDAAAWLAKRWTELSGGQAIDSKAGLVPLKEYAETWMARRPDLRPSTAAKYRMLLDRHIIPALGKTVLVRLQTSQIRGWWAKLATDHPSTAADAYRLLSTICNTAVDDKVIGSNPCKVKGAGTAKAAERPTASVAEVGAAIDEVPADRRAAILLAAWCQLRRSEVLGLQRRDVDLLHSEITVSRGLVVDVSYTTTIGDPKSDAGKRTIAVPDNVMPALTEHLEHHVDPKPTAWLFPGENGQPITPRTLDRVWERARRKIKRPDLRLHDLRHSGLTWTAATGATTAELMHRAGHASPVAAIRYQHATKDRDRALAAALAGLASPAPVLPLKAAGKR